MRERGKEIVVNARGRGKKKKVQFYVGFELQTVKKKTKKEETEGGGRKAKLAKNAKEESFERFWLFGKEKE